ncbi:MAG: hypothetical protein AAF446_09550, partial [Pseudomonadota bacterium]
FVPDVEGQLESEGDGLLSVLDGSSAESFKESLAWIAADTSRDQYAELESAIRFLHLYDQSSLANDENMRKTLDGMTGEEIILRARELNSMRRSRN